MEIILDDLGIKFGEQELLFVADKDVEDQIVDFLEVKGLVPSQAKFTSTIKDSAKAAVIRQILTDRGWQFGTEEGLPKWLIITTVVMVLAALVVVVLIIVKNRQTSPQRPVTVTVTPTSIVVPTPTAAPKAREDLKIQVLNGSGTPGQAGVWAKRLIKLGFAEAETGNADEKGEVAQVNYTAVVSQVIIDELVKELEADFTTVKSTLTPTLEGFDLQVVTATE